MLLGAGFSKWAADLPLASDLFDFAIEPFGPRDQRKLQSVMEAKGYWDAWHPGGHPEQFVGWAMDQAGEVGEAMMWYITHRLTIPFVHYEFHAGRTRRHVLGINDPRKWRRPGVTRARQWLTPWLPKLTGVITTNYDLLVEYALGTRGFHYGYTGEVLSGRGHYPVSQWRNPVVLRGAAPISKVHGSISWEAGRRNSDGRGAIHGRALIVAPAHEKTPPASLAGEWALAGRILAESRGLIVFGFAFNPYDEAFGQHLRQFGKGIEHVTWIDKAPQLERVESIFPSARIEVVAPPECVGP